MLANVLEDASHSQQQPDPTAAGASNSSSSSIQDFTVPLDDPDTTAWEEALSLMYPSVPLFEISWANAARLLLLADKYDMPCLKAHVQAFLDTPQQAFAVAPAAAEGGGGGAAAAARQVAEPAARRPWYYLRRLEAQLSDGSNPNLPCVFEWLQVCSKCGLEQHAEICIQHIVKRQLALPAGIVASIRPYHAEQLMTRLQEALVTAQRQLHEAALSHVDRHRCTACGRLWFMQPSSRSSRSGAGSGALEPAPACLYCGGKHHSRRARLVALLGAPAVGAAVAAAEDEQYDSSDEEESEEDEDLEEEDSADGDVAGVDLVGPASDLDDEGEEDEDEDEDEDEEDEDEEDESDDEDDIMSEGGI